MPALGWIVVGSGPAGCLVASRLARQTGRRVGLIETRSQPGAVPAAHQQRPIEWLRLLGSDLDWDLETEPSPSLAGRRLRWPRGKGLGGSSQINAMIWFPPTKDDFSCFCRHAGGPAAGWTVDRLQAAYHEVEQIVRPETPRWISDTARWFLGYANDHSCDDDQRMLYRRFNRSGRRWNAGQLIADQSRSKSNAQAAIEIIDGQVDQLIFDQQRVVGATVVGPAADRFDVVADCGVVLCAGTIGTPGILLRSGFGPRDVLNDLKIPLRRESQQLGENLQDHLLMPIIYRTTGENFSRHRGDIRELTRWQTVGAGKPACNLAECGGLFRDQTVQLHVTPTHYLTYPQVSTDPMMTVGINLTRPRSRGRLSFASPRWDAPPRISADYLSDADDRYQMIKAIEWLRGWMEPAHFGGWIEDEVLPGSKRTGEAALARVLARYAQTLYHPVGTNAIGSDPGCGVNPDFRVRDTAGLWCVDASILPQISTGNPTTLVMTLALLAADQIAGSVVGSMAGRGRSGPAPG